MVRSKINNREIHTPADLVRKGPGRCLQWTLAYGFLLFMFLYGFFNIVMACPSYGWSGRAKSNLRSIGISQLAYQDANSDKKYGSFNELKDSLYIAEGYTLGNMIENYSMSWSVLNVSTVATEEFPFGVMSTFTIIAYPRVLEQRCIQTFAITEDQVVRMYNPDNENEFLDLKSWDPIL